MKNPLLTHRSITHPLSLAIVATLALSACSHTRTHEPGYVDPATASVGASGEIRWTRHADFGFTADSNQIMPGDDAKAREIASFVARSPTRRICLDGANSRRVGVVRDALIAAGVPPRSIQSDKFGDPERRRDDRVAVLVSG